MRGFVQSVLTSILCIRYALYVANNYGDPNMRELFPDLLKWSIGALFIVFGIHFLMLTQISHSPKPFILVILCFGATYLISRTVYKKDYDYGLSGAALLGSFFLAKTVDVSLLFVGAGFFQAWCFFVLALGVPAIAYGKTKLA